MNAMTDQEMENPERIKAPQREKIALKAEAVHIIVSVIIRLID